jgi:hypothetical protein
MPSLKNEGINAPVGADKQAILARYQGLEVAKSTHRLASENWLPGVKPMKPIVAFSADNPRDGIGMSIRCGHDRRAFAP